MKIEIMGTHPLAGVFGWLFTQAGYETLWKRSAAEASVAVEILDGRKEKRGIRIQNEWKPISNLSSKADWIILFPSWGELEKLVGPVSELQSGAKILVLAPCWTELKVLEKLMPGKTVFWGLPTAGGIWTGEDALRSAVMAPIHWGTLGTVDEPVKNELAGLFTGAGFQPRFHEDLQTWLWISFAVNAGLNSQILSLVPATAGGTVEEAADLLFSSSRRLSRAVLAIREALRVVQARGADCRAYKSEVGPYNYPAWFASFVLHGILKKNEPALDIMKMPGGPDELLDALNEVTATARELKVPLKHLTVPQ